MNKMELYNALDAQISPTVIIQKDGHYVVQGKWATVTPMDSGIFDVWIHNPADVAKGLGTGKVNNIIKAMPSSVTVRQLDGEADCELTAGQVLAVLKVLGIRRKRVMSEEQKAAVAARLRRGREMAA